MHVESCHQGLIVSRGLSRCLAGAVVFLSSVIVTVLMASGLAVKSVETVTLCPLSLSSLLNHGFQVEGRILIVAA
jgi:hypothetical protein